MKPLGESNVTMVSVWGPSHRMDGRTGGPITHQWENEINNGLIKDLLEGAG